MFDGKTWIYATFSIKKNWTTPPFWPRKGLPLFKIHHICQHFPHLHRTGEPFRPFPRCARRRVWRIEQVTRWSVLRTPWIRPNGKAWMERSRSRDATKGLVCFFLLFLGEVSVEPWNYSEVVTELVIFFLILAHSYFKPWKSKTKESGWSWLDDSWNSGFPILPRDKVLFFGPLVGKCFLY